jgi:cytochrome c oxidase subunit 3
MIKISHPFHIVSPSPWPIVASLVLLSAARSLILRLHSNFLTIITIIVTANLIAITAAIWWRDVKREASLQGHHTFNTISLLKYRIIIFIVSEIIFFLRFFWAYFHRRISPNIELGVTWPPIGVKIFNPIEIPLLNSIILLSSGATITWSHHSFLSKNIKSRFRAASLVLDNLEAVLLKLNIKPYTLILLLLGAF